MLSSVTATWTVNKNIIVSLILCGFIQLILRESKHYNKFSIPWTTSALIMRYKILVKCCSRPHFVLPFPLKKTCHPPAPLKPTTLFLLIKFHTTSYYFSKKNSSGNLIVFYIAWSCQWHIYIFTNHNLKTRRLPCKRERGRGGGGEREMHACLYCNSMV